MVQFTNPLHGLRFHELMRDGGYKSRIRIYSIDLSQNPIDVSNQAEVEEFADLLKYKNSDTDSNGRIAESGIKLNNYYNKDDEYTIGNAPIASIDISFINDDGYFSAYDWEQTVIIYWDVWDPLNSIWITCPLGVYWWERPAKTSVVTVNATAYDGMYRLGQYTSWSWPTFENGPYTLGTVYTSLVSNIAGILPYATPGDWPNMTVTIDSAPFDVTNMTNREILAKLAEIAGSNVFASRDGHIKMKPFTDAYWKPAPQAQPIYYELDGDSLPTPITKIEIGEYTVPSITQFIAQVGQTGKEFTIGSGTQTMYSINNGFLAVDDTKANQMITTMLGVVSGTDASSDMVPYVPLYIRAYADPTVEASDIIRVIRNETTYLMPVFQQTLYWNGADWIVEMQNSGYAKRSIPSEAERESYVNQYRLSQLEPYRGGDEQTDSTPYSFRPSGGGTLGNVNRETDSLIGGTVAWNQLAKNFESRSQTLGITITADNTNGTIRAYGTASTTNNLYFARNVPIVTDHIYYLRGSKTSSHGIRFSDPLTVDEGSGKLFKGNAAASNRQLQYFFTSGDVIDETLYPQIFDLTVMFGSTIANYVYSLESNTAGAGIAWLKSYGFFTKTYYSYNAGTLMSVNASAHKMTGFNQWDEEWELGGYNSTTGAKEPASSYFRCKNPIRAVSGATYNYCSPIGGANVYFYDESDNYLSYVGVPRNTTFAIPSNCGYIRFRVYNYGTTYNHDICINLSNTSGSPKNGDYVPYVEHSYPLDPDLQLRGILKLDASNNLYYDGDTYESYGTVTRKYGIVDLGTLAWGKLTSNYVNFYSTGISSVVKRPSTTADGYKSIICSKYSSVPISASNDNYIYITADGQIRIKDTANAALTTDEFKSLMSGVYAVYELATPTTETADPYINPQAVDANGTEQYVDAGARDFDMPVGHDTGYYNLTSDAQQIYDTPSADGTYRLICTVTNGVPAYSWVRES